MSYLLASALLFALGVYGVLTRRTAILVFLSIELMLNAANLSLVGFARAYGLDGQVAALMVIAVAAAEVAVGLGPIVAILRHRARTALDAAERKRFCIDFHMSRLRSVISFNIVQGVCPMTLLSWLRNCWLCSRKVCSERSR